jgi:N-acetylglucosaminyl-diphospho-decaprenol L-rhamnosyltransferase
MHTQVSPDRRPETAGREAPTTSRTIDFELVVVGYRSRDEIAGMLAGLPAEVPAVLVDNSHDADGLREFAEGRPRTRYLDAGGVGFARAANLGARAARRDVIVFVNPDTRPTIGTLWAIVDDVRADASLISSSPLNVGGDGEPEFGVGGWEPSVARALVHTLALHKLFPHAGLFAKPRLGEPIDLDWVTGSCMAVSRERFEALGGFDERYYVYNEDMALGHAARQRGLVQRLRTDLTVPHAVGGSGAPSTEMLRLRGASMRRYLLHRKPRLEAVLISDAIGAGFVVRTALFAALRRTDKAKGDAAYVRGILTGRATVGGVVVTDREDAGASLRAVPSRPETRKEDR